MAKFSLNGKNLFLHDSLERFKNRFRKGIKININSVIENRNEKLPGEFSKNMKDKKILQLYHSIRNGLDSRETAKSIFENGFNDLGDGNKGYGTYLSSHSSYSYFWGGRNHIIICDVICDEKYVKRFISEIYSEENNWEYVVKKPKLIYPRFYVEYTEEKNVEFNKIWTNHRCEICQTTPVLINQIHRRCDCPQFPTYLEDDSVCLGNFFPLY